MSRRKPKTRKPLIPPVYKGSVRLDQFYRGQGPLRPFAHDLYEHYIEQWRELADWLSDESTPRKH